jgi:hypothetical protein
MGHVPYLRPVVTTRTRVGLVGTEGNYPSNTRVGLLSSHLARIPCNLVASDYIRAGRDPLQNTSNPKAIQAIIQDVGYYAHRDPNLSKSLYSLQLRVRDLSDTSPIICHLGGIPRWA